MAIHAEGLESLWHLVSFSTLKHLVSAFPQHPDHPSQPAKPGDQTSRVGGRKESALCGHGYGPHVAWD